MRQSLSTRDAVGDVPGGAPNLRARWRRPLIATLLAVPLALGGVPALDIPDRHGSVTLGSLAAAHAAIAVPPGNRSEVQPPIPGGARLRTAAKRTSFERKYQRILALLTNDRKLRSRIEKVSKLYGIDPVHVAGALVGEHTYNVDAYDRLQTYAVKAVRYVKSDIAFGHGGESVTRFVSRDEFAPCEGARDSETLWTCREEIWEADFKGRTVDGRSYPDDRFSAVFFQPFYAGQTFGLGQMNPLQALKVSDRVARVSGLRKLDARRGERVYEAIMDPDASLHYVAATIRAAIDAYAAVGYDISGNPGITATLYNLGRVHRRAASLKGRGGLPRENYYGWLVNEREAELRALF